MEKTRALKTLKACLPETPRRRVVLLKTYLQKTNSPTVKHLEDMKIVRSPDEIADTSLTENAILDIKTLLETTKKQRSKESNMTRQVLFAAINGETVEASKQKKQLAAKFGIKRGAMTTATRVRTKILKSESSCYKLTERKTRNNNIPDEHKKIAYMFWLSSGVSRPTGNKKDVKRERLDTRIFVSHMVHILEKNQTEVYNDFRETYPAIKMSQRSFERLKPFFVRPVRPGDRNTCLCRYHVELKAVFDCCMKQRKNIQERKDDQDTLSTRYPIYRNVNEAIAATLCDKTEENYNISCLKRDCGNCGVNNFKLMDEEKGADMVQWERFEYVIVSSKGNQVRKKLMMVKKKTCIEELFTYFIELLKTFPSHQFRANWQRQQLKYLTTNLPLNDCAVIHDFSENYR